MRLSSMLALGVVLSAAREVTGGGEPAFVVAGDRAKGDPEVVALAGPSGGIYCSGTLVSPRVIVTAAHCIDANRPGWAFFGVTPADGGVFVPVRLGARHPGYDKSTHDNDVGVVLLERAAPVRPAELWRGGVAVGDSVRLVAFGTTGFAAGGLGTKRETTTEILDFTEGSFRMGPSACHGDSGGSVFVTTPERDALAGVISYGDGQCAERSIAMRVDRLADWIDELVSLLDPPLCTLDRRCVPGCVTHDPDCDAE